MSKDCPDLCSLDENVFQGIRESILILSEDFMIIRANKAFLRQKNCKEEDVIGRRCYEVLHNFEAPCLPKDFLCPIRESLRTDEPTTVEHSYTGPKGNIIHCEVSAYPVKDEKGKILYFIHYSKDISKRKKLYEELRLSELKYKTIFESSKDAIMLLTPEKGFFRGNPATLKMFNCESEDAFDALGPASLSPEYQPDGTLSAIKAQEMMSIAIKKGSHFFEWTHKRLSGEEFPSTVLLTRTTLDGKEILQATVRDISKQKKAEQQIKEHEERLQFTIDAAGLGIWEFDIKNNTAWRSEHHDHIFGYTKMLPEWNYDIFISHIVPEHREEIEEAFKTAISSNQNWTYECKIRRKDGQIRWIWGAGRTIFNEHGEPIKLLGLIQDITERKSR